MINKFYLVLFGVLVLVFIVFYLKLDSKRTNILKIGDSSIKVEIVTAPKDKELGLSGRSSLPEGSGMLFDYSDNPQPQVFWMKDMLIPIDILWLKDGEISKIDSAIKPPLPGTPVNSLEKFPSPGTVEYVLEVPAGYAEKKGLKAGDSYELQK